MEFFAKKRIEIFVEAPFLERLTSKLDKQKVPGYTVMPAVSGRGSSSTSAWKRDGSVSQAGVMMCVVLIIDAKLVEPLMEEVFPPLARQIGIISISDTTVVRPERF
jgi:nitrogen regulatory protein PII